MLDAIGACGNGIWCNSLGDIVLMSFVILSHNGKKLVKGQLWAEVIQVMILGHVKVLRIVS